jgi:hypothetical protein
VTVRRARFVWVALFVALGACTSGAKQDDAGTTIVERRKVSTSTGGATASPEAPPEANPDDPNAPCKHAWVHLTRATHAWTDFSSGFEMVSLCTPIHCPKCGEVRHECEQRRRRAR